MVASRHAAPAGFRMFLLLLLCSSCAGPQPGRPAAGAARQETQGIRGTLTYRGEALEGAYVYAYRSASTGLLGPADFASNLTGPDGRYTLELVRGPYHIVARKRLSGEDSGPLAMGDFYSIYPSNPVSVEEGRYRVVDLDLVQMKDPLFFQGLSRRTTGTGIRGTIVDGEGRPVPWVFAMVYTSGDMKRMPAYTSVMTGTDGTFVIYLPGGGRYWLAARKNIRGRPRAGEPYGLYEGEADHSVTVPEGQFVEGVTIRLENFREGTRE